ncbi:MAG: LysM repeat protein/ABC-type branched-subunit amino acid transport system substrate-binding protein [Rubritalea sp.]|jgi:LysM repeat protein/ABC-type branched-subunit amino acid transport system substrate-binding protein
MKNILFIVCICLAFAKAEAALVQNYKQHTVEQGETVYTLAQKYKVTSQQLLELNPDLKSGLKYGQVLLIPAQNKILTQRKIKNYKKHRVRRKETLYSLSKKYAITELDIKEANKELYSNPLRKGDRIQIPIFEKLITAVKELETKGPLSNRITLQNGKYLVQPSEGMYGIAKKYGIKTDSLQRLNPNIKDLKPGMILNVPKNISAVKQSNVASPTIDNNPFIEYVIPEKMGMYSLKKLARVSEDSLVSMNPELKNGLKEGMTIMIPNPNYGEIKSLKSKISGTANLIDSLRNFNRQHLAIMLPFSLQKIDKNTIDRDNLKSDKTMRIALDFYSGLKIAIDSANTLGISVDYDVFDTQRNVQTTKKILAGNDFSKYNTVIGPLISSNVIATSKELKGINIPVISPLTNTDVILYRNLFQARPSDEMLKNKLKEYLVQYAIGKHVIIITDNNKPELKKEFTVLLPSATVLIPNNEKNRISKMEFIKQLKQGVENVVVLAAGYQGLIDGAVLGYSVETKTNQITMFGLENYEDMELSNTKLAQLNYIYPSIFKENNSTNSFIDTYYSIHNITPNAHATRGFDITLDVILRQASASGLYESAMKNGQTVMTENKFDYSKKFLAGFYNDAIYILQYQEDLSIKELNFKLLNKEDK